MIMLKRLLFILIPVILAACASTPKPSNPPASPVAETPAQPQSPAQARSTILKGFIPGPEQALACDQIYPGVDKLAGRPNFQVMWENYINDEPLNVFNYLGGEVAVNGNLPPNQGRWENACTVRLSHMLHMAGHDIPWDSNKTVSGEYGDKYYYRVSDIEKYLLKIWGSPDVAVVDGTGNQYDLPNTPGVVVMDFPDGSFTGHVTLWNGKETVDESNIGGYRVIFWNLPCFIPSDRVGTSGPVASLSSIKDLTP